MMYKKPKATKRQKRAMASLLVMRRAAKGKKRTGGRTTRRK